MIMRFAKSHGGQRCFYDRTGRRRRSRVYHLFSIARIVDKEAAAWRLIVGPVVFVFRFKPRRGA